MIEAGLLLIDKEAGMTSREVDNRIGRRFNTHKVGHLGTLDPFATGLLVVAVNKGTKFLPYILDEEKTYQASLKLGIKTSTGDYTGESIEEKAVPSLNKETISKALESLLGESLQIPPMTSAKKVDGEPLYKKAHKGIEIERMPIKITVHEANLDEYIESEKIIRFTVKVSKGTYIRTLGEDLAQRLNTVGHLLSLRRMNIGELSVIDAKSIEEAEFKEPIDFLSNFEKISVSEEDVKSIKDGRPLSIKSQNEKVLLVMGNEPLAIYKKGDGETYLSERGLF